MTFYPYRELTNHKQSSRVLWRDFAAKLGEFEYSTSSYLLPVDKTVEEITKKDGFECASHGEILQH